MHTKIVISFGTKILMITLCCGVKTVASIVVRGSVRMRVSGGLGGLKNTRIIEEAQWFILVWANRYPTSSS